MDEENRNRIAWALMIAHFKKKGLLINEGLIATIDTVYAPETGLHPEDVRRLVCHMIMNISIGLPWGAFGDLTQPKVHKAIWPVFKALASRHPALRTLRRSDPDITDTLSTILYTAAPELARRAGLRDAEVSEVLVLAVNEILDEREHTPHSPADSSITPA